MRRLLRYLLALLLVLVVATCVVGWWVFYRPLPQLDGTHLFPELGADVTVDRDAWGVPHIQAVSMEDAVSAQGYVTAQDRLWQMDLLRRIAAGELSEIVGRRALELDRENRTLGLHRAAQRSLAVVDTRTRAVLEAYARGVNRYIEERRGNLPWEFTVLRYTPRPWQPADSLLVAGYVYNVLTSSWRAEFDRARLTARVGAERARDLFVVDSPLDHVIVGAQAPPREPAPQNPQFSPAPAPPKRPEAEVASLPPDAVMSAFSNRAQADLARFEAETEYFVGSNNWVVSGVHTYSGKPLLANDTHLPLNVPCIWYMTHLTAPGLNVKGFTIPGAPLVILGHNDRIAWGFTNNGADVQDLYAEKSNPANPREFLHNGKWVPAEVRQEKIRVRGEPDETLDVVTTRHGPIITRDADAAYALRWTATEPGGLSAGYSLLGLAQNWQEFRDQLRRISGPAQNIVYADVDGNIGYIVAANIPVRRRGDGSVPVPGDTDDWDWIGYIPFDELPQVFNPPGGIIATANARVTGPAYRWHLTLNWMDPHRTARIHELLEQGKKFRPEDFIAIQTDVLSIPHRQLANHVARAAQEVAPSDVRAREIIERLATWDGIAKTDSVETSLLEYTRRALMRRLLAPFVQDGGLRYRWWRHPIFLDNVLRERSARWLPEGYASFDQLVSAAVDEAAKLLAEQSGAEEASGWNWGRLHRIEMAHPLAANAVLRRLLNAGPDEDSGTGFTVKQAGGTFGPSQRFVADLADWDNSLMNITLGQSGQIGSRHYRDQFLAWYEGRGIAAPFTPAALNQVRKHRLLLLSPAGPSESK